MTVSTRRTGAGLTASARRSHAVVERLATQGIDAICGNSRPAIRMRTSSSVGTARSQDSPAHRAAGVPVYAGDRFRRQRTA